MNDQMPALLTVEEMARQLRLGRSKAWELVATGEIQSVQIGRARRVTPLAIAAYIERLELATSA